MKFEDRVFIISSVWNGLWFGDILDKPTIYF